MRLQPDFAGAHTTLAAVLRQLGDTEGAQTETRTGAQIVKQTVGNQAALLATNSGRKFRSTGDLESAISQFRSAIASSPNYARAHYELAITLRQQGKAAEAAEEFTRAQELDSRLVIPAP